MHGYFNPLPPHGGRRSLFPHWKRNCSISIHSLRMEGDDGRIYDRMHRGGFQSTPSAWRETRVLGTADVIDDYFNPLPPHGGRHSRRSQSCGQPANFNPLPPHGGRRQSFFHLLSTIIISIHSLRMEGDSIFLTPFVFPISFQSTPSAWRETAKLHRKAFFISPILVQSCKKGCKRLHSAPEKMVFFEKREKNLVRNLQHLSVRL